MSEERITDFHEFEGIKCRVQNVDYRYIVIPFKRLEKSQGVGLLSLLVSWTILTVLFVYSLVSSIL